MDNRPIGVFDSGIGGLTVLKEIIKILPNEQFIYYADTAHVPYGTKPKEKVKQYIFEAVDFLIRKNVKAIVVACNTATSIAIQDLRKKYRIPIIGIEPAAKPAVENRKGKKVLIMATPTTIREEKLKLLLEKLDAQDTVDLVAMPELVEFAEEEKFDTQEVKMYIQEVLKEYNLQAYSAVVLGCTHFPFFKKTFKEIMPQGIQLIDGSIGVAQQLKNKLQENNLLGKQVFQIDYYYSGEKVTDLQRLARLLERP